MPKILQMLNPFIHSFIYSFTSLIATDDNTLHVDSHKLTLL